MENSTLENPCTIEIMGTPACHSECPPDCWALVICVERTRRIIVHRPDGEHGRSRIIVDQSLLPVSQVYAVSLPKLRDSSLSELKQGLEIILEGLSVLNCREYAERIIQSARTMADRFRGKGPFKLEANIHMLASSTLNEHEPDAFPIPEEDYEPVGRGATKEAISRLLQCARKAGDQTGADLDSCSICLRGITGEDELVGMPCKHMFHGPCITRWLETSRSCPLCRHTLDD